MSQDPFHRDTNVSPATPAGTTPAGTTSPPPKKRRIWLRVILALIGGGFLTLLICCGAGLYAVQNYGGFMFDPIRKDMNQMSELRDQVGEIESLNMNVFATVEEGKNNPEFVIFDGQSEQGPFQVSAKMGKSGDLEKVFLVMPEGNRKPIDMSKRVAPPVADAAESADETPAETSVETPAEEPVDEPAETAAETAAE